MWKPRSALIWNTTTAAVAKLLPLASSQAWGLFLFFYLDFWLAASSSGGLLPGLDTTKRNPIWIQCKIKTDCLFPPDEGSATAKLSWVCFFFCCFFNLRHTRATPGHDSVCIHSWRTQRPTARFKRSQQNECVCAQLSPAIEGMDWLMWWLMSVRLGASGRGQVYSLLHCLCAHEICLKAGKKNDVYKIDSWPSCYRLSKSLS